jgi:hypothetical protein
MAFQLTDRKGHHMAADHLNSTRAGRSIDNLDKPKHTAIDPGSGTSHGRKTPRYADEVVAKEGKDALDHVQVSGIGDIAEDGREVPTVKSEKP